MSYKFSFDYDFVSGASQANLGEGLILIRDCLYWVDILGTKIYKYDIKNHQYSEWVLPKSYKYPSAILPYNLSQTGTTFPSFGDGTFIVPCHNRILLWNSSNNYSTHDTIHPKSFALFPSDLRFNDCRLDPKGGLWLGTLHLQDLPNQAALYKWKDNSNACKCDPGYCGCVNGNSAIHNYIGECPYPQSGAVAQIGGQLTTMLHNVSLSNGFGWSADHKVFYHIDTPTRQISVYKCDPVTLDIVYPAWRTISLTSFEGVPDGMFIGPDNIMYVCMWDGSQILEIREICIEGDTYLHYVNSIEMPFSRPTSCVLLNNNELYVMSAAVDGEEHSGKLMRFIRS